MSVPSGPAARAGAAHTQGAAQLLARREGPRQPLRLDMSESLPVSDPLVAPEAATVHGCHVFKPDKHNYYQHPIDP